MTGESLILSQVREALEAEGHKGLGSKLARLARALEAAERLAEPLAESPVDLSVDSDNQPDLLMPGRWTPEDEIIKTGSHHPQESRVMPKTRKADVASPAAPLDIKNELQYLTPPDEKHSTDSLPEVGHDSAVDDDQQVTASVKILKEVAAALTGTDRKLARRISELGNVVAAEFGPADEGQPGADFSTAGLPESGHDKANDESQVGDTLEFFGTTPPNKVETGPETKSASKIAFKTEVTASEDDDEDETSDVKAGPDTIVGSEVEASGDKVASQDGYKKSIEAALQNLSLEAVGGNEAELRHAKKLLKSLAASDSTSKVSSWETLKKTLKSASSKVKGTRVAGSWACEVEDYGNVVELSLTTRNREGAQLSPGSVTFNLLNQNPRTKVATVEVADGLVSDKTGTITLTASQAEQFAHAWMNRLNQMGNTTLAELSL